MAEIYTYKIIYGWSTAALGIPLWEKMTRSSENGWELIKIVPHPQQHEGRMVYDLFWRKPLTTETTLVYKE